MKKYIIMSMSMDGTTCDADGIYSACAFDLIGTRACDTLEEAIAVRDETIETDLADFQGLWVEEDGYSYECGEMPEDVRALTPDKFIDVYCNGEIINETIYKIREVEC